MTDIDPLSAALVFCITAAMDALHVLYTKAVGQSRPALAATSWSAIYVISAIAVIQYTSNWKYLFFVCAGSWIGTYVTVKNNVKDPKSEAHPKLPSENSLVMYINGL